MKIHPSKALSFDSTRPIVLTYVFLFVMQTVTGCTEKSDPNALCEPKERSVRSDLKSDLCVDLVDEVGEVSSDRIDHYSELATEVTFHGLSTNKPASCEGTSYDFGVTENTTIRVTVKLAEANEDVLPQLDLAEGDVVKLRYRPAYWTPASLLIEDATGPVYQVRGSEPNWLSVSHGKQVDTYCNDCGLYGVYELLFSTDNGTSTQSLSPGEIGEINHDKKNYNVANISATRDIKIRCTDVYGSTIWALWRLPN